MLESSISSVHPKSVIGIDIGGTSIKGAVVQRDGTELYTMVLSTDASLGRKGILARLHEIITELLHSSTNVTVVGIATAGRVNVGTGAVVYATDNLPGWEGLQLADYVQSSFGLRTVVENDANAALLGEAWLGAGSGEHSAVMLTLGTGVGGAYIEGDRLCHGAHWSAGDWGHSILVPGGELCNCGKRGCVEQYISGSALKRRACEGTGRVYRTGTEVMNDVTLGDVKALKVLKEYARDVATVITNISVTIDPSVIIIGGGVEEAGDVWWPLLDQYMRYNKVVTQVKRAILGNRAGYIGAARLALEV